MLVALAAVAAVALGTWRFLSRDGAVVDVAAGDVVVERDGSEAPDPGAAAESPFATAGPAADAVDARRAVPAEPAVPAPAPTTVDDSPVDLASLGREPIGDDEFERLAARLRDDPALLAALIDEVRSETDPVRLERLLRLLGDVDDPAVTALATELVYSGDDASRTLGLDLMKRIGGADAGVVSAVSGLLSTEVDGEVLVPALTALARPGRVGGAEADALAGQVALLTGHEDPAVRRTSLDILSRWSDDATYTPQLLAGLDDPDPTVRRTAAFAFVGHADDSDEVRRALFAVAEDDASEEAPRRGAILALRGMPVGDDERARIDAIERRLDTRPLR